MARDCVLCGDEETEEMRLVPSPCGQHFFCHDCMPSVFQHAMDDESLYPPKCCDRNGIFFIDDYEHILDYELIWKFKMKEMGEYSVNPRFRVYCSNRECAAFLHPDAHLTSDVQIKVQSKDGQSVKPTGQLAVTESQPKPTEVKKSIKYADCNACSMRTCLNCKHEIKDTKLHNHVCDIPAEDEKFQETAEKEGYKECYNCGRVVELAEACNHITCECGEDFCYICGKYWEGLHGCPHYGPPVYDDEGYNQDGYHRDTGLNRDGRTRREQMREDGGEDEEDDEPWVPLQIRNDPVLLEIWESLPDDIPEDLRWEEFQVNAIMMGIQIPVLEEDDEDGQGEGEGEDEEGEDEDEDGEDEDEDSEGEDEDGEDEDEDGEGEDEDDQHDDNRGDNKGVHGANADATTGLDGGTGNTLGAIATAYHTLTNVFGGFSSNVRIGTDSGAATGTSSGNDVDIDGDIQMPDASDDFLIGAFPRDPSPEL